MKKFIQTAILIGVSAAISFLFVSFIVQADWTPPTETAPTCGLSEPACNTPINVSSSAQLKTGPLGIGGLFTAYSDAYFTGKVGIGTSTDAKYALNVNGDINIVSGKKLYIGGEPAIFSNWTRDDAKKYLYLTNTGYNVGIGTATPGAKLDVAGNIIITGGNMTSRMAIETNWMYTLESTGDGWPIPRCNANGSSCDTTAANFDCPDPSFEVIGDGGSAVSVCYDHARDPATDAQKYRKYEKSQPATRGGWISATSAYGDTIRLGGDSGGEDLEVRISAPSTRNIVSFWNDNAGVNGLADIKAKYVRGESGLCIAGVCKKIWDDISLPSGSSGQTLRYDGANWIANSNIFNDGTNVGIGTNIPNQTLHILGNIRIAGVTGSPDTATLLIGSGNSDNIPSFPTIPCSTGSYSASLCGTDDANNNVDTALNGCPNDKPATTGSKDYNDVAKGSTIIGGDATDAWFKRTVTCVNPDEPLYKMKNIGGSLVFENNRGVQTLKVGQDGNTIFSGQIKIVDGLQGLTKVLTSDADGLASWQSPSAITEIDHGALTGLIDDDHAQYLLASGTRAMTGALKMSATEENDITNISSIIGYNDLFIKSDSSESKSIHYGASKHSFYTGGEEKVTIDSDGNVGIGTKEPNQTLHILGNIRIAGVTGSPDTATLLIGSGNSDNIPSFPTIPCSTGSYSASLCGTDDANNNVDTALNGCPNDKPATTGSKDYNDVAKGSTIIGGDATDAWFKRTVTCVNPDEPLYKMKNIGGSLVFENNRGVQTLKVGQDGNTIFSGQIKIVDGLQGLTKVLTSDADGLASWQLPSVGGGVIKHGALTGLINDDHAQYLLASGTRAMTGALKMSATEENDITNISSIIGYNDLFIKSDSSESKSIHYSASKHSFYTGKEEKVTIDSDGNVGIGTKEPKNKLEVWGNVKIASQTSGALSNSLEFGSGKTDSVTEYDYNNIITTKPASSKDTCDGKVGESITEPGVSVCPAALNDGSCTDWAYVSITTPTGGVKSGWTFREWSCFNPDEPLYRIANQSGNLKFINNSDNENLVITQIGNVGIGTAPSGSYNLEIGGAKGALAASWNTSSDIRLKTGVTPLESSLNKILNLQGVNFEWKNNPGEKQIGFIAQDVEKIIPELVHTDANGMKSLSYDKLTAVIVEAIKELKAENNSLKARIEKLETE